MCDYTLHPTELPPRAHQADVKSKPSFHKMSQTKR